MKRRTKSETLRRRIVWHLRHVWAWGEGGSSWISFAALAAELGEKVSIVKREVRRCARAGRLEYSWLCDRDGIPHGGGYLLTWDWLLHQPGRAEDPADDEFEVADA